MLIVAVVTVASLTPAPAEASPEVLRRGLGNIINGPLDMLLSPLVGGYTVAKNIADIDDTAAVRLVYVLPGWVWLAGLNFGSGAIRTVTGCLEMLPGVLLYPFETDIDPLFDSVETAGAWVDWPNPLNDTENPWLLYNPVYTLLSIDFRFGLNYTRAEL
jgi:hypothetical protein